MKNASNRTAKLIRVEIKNGSSGLLYATSPDLYGLLVAKPTIEGIEGDIPRAIQEIFSVKGEDVLAIKIDNQEHPESWVVIPTSLAIEKSSLQL